MKKVIAIFMLAISIASNVFANDEICMYEKNKKVQCGIIEMSIQDNILYASLDTGKVISFDVSEEENFFFQYDDKMQMKIFDKTFKYRKNEKEAWHYIDD